MLDDQDRDRRSRVGGQSVHPSLCLSTLRANPKRLRRGQVMALLHLSSTRRRAESFVRLPTPMNAVEPCPPPPSTLERWAWDYIRASELAAKFELAEPPGSLEIDAPPRRAVRPARSERLVASGVRAKTPGRAALRKPLRRAQLVHTFLHHELQAAALRC